MHSVEVEGRDRITVSPDSDRFSRTSRACTVECASGERRTDEWTGVAVAELAEAADFSGETTHLRIEAEGFLADVPIGPALGGVLAFDREGARDEERGLPRFVAAGVSGERLVKRVRRISGVSLAPGEDPKLG